MIITITQASSAHSNTTIFFMIMITINSRCCLEVCSCRYFAFVGPVKEKPLRSSRKKNHFSIDLYIRFSLDSYIDSTVKIFNLQFLVGLCTFSTFDPVHFQFGHSNIACTRFHSIEFISNGHLTYKPNQSIILYICRWNRMDSLLYKYGANWFCGLPDKRNCFHCIG